MSYESGPIRRSEHSVTIAKGATVSGAVDIKAGRILGVMMPADWDSADLKFVASADGGTTYYDVYDDAGNEIALTVASDRFIVFDANTLDNLAGISNFKAVASATQSSQAATLIFVVG